MPLSFYLLLTSPVFAQASAAALDADRPGILLRPELEAGFLGVLSHTLQLDSGGNTSTW